MQNDMRDRLIALLRADMTTECDKYDDCSACVYRYDENACYNHLASIAADHLIANGVIVPPCKVGETVYCINTFFQNDPRINVCEVDAIHITSGKNRIGHKKTSYALVRDTNMKQLSSRIYFENFGKTVFLTKDQAEQKLKELSENG